jgi:anti-sigma factor RsiW
MNARCALVRMRLPGVDSVDELGERLVGHVETCLRCQAEVARYRTLRRRLGALSRDLMTAPVTLVPSVVVRIETAEAAPSGDLRVGLRRAAVAVSAAAGAAVAATAGTIIVVGLRRSHHAA